MSLKDLIRESLLDVREFEFGQVWTVSDELISIPDADRIGERDLHQYRSVLIVSNHSGNSNPLLPVVTVAPLSHRVELMKKGDVELEAQRDNLRVDSIVRLRLMQPVLKADIVNHVATISDDGKEDILNTIEEFFSLIPEG